MPPRTESKITRISFDVDKDLYDKTESIPWGVRASILRILLERVVEAADKQGKMIYGAIMDGKFDIRFRK